MDALKASRAKPGDTVYVWNYGDGTRHELQSIDDGHVLDLNCNKEDFEDEDDE
jgi:hypothetical protein